MSIGAQVKHRWRMTNLQNIPNKYSHYVLSSCELIINF